MNNSLILYMQLYVPKISSVPSLAGKSWLLSAASRLKDRDVYAFADPSIKKDLKLGRVFSNISPKDIDEFTLELGVALPDLFPNLEDKPEFAVEIPSGGEKYLLCVSNRMAKLRFVEGSDYCHIIIPASSEGTKTEEKNDGKAEVPSAPTAGEIQISSPKSFSIPESAHAEFLKTTVTVRFTIHGVDVEDALSKELENKILLFIDLLNKFALANLMVKKDQPGITTPIYDRQTFDSMYMIVQGKEEEKIGLGRIALNLAKLNLNPASYTPLESKTLTDYLNGENEVDEAQRFLLSAKSYMDGGLLHASLLHLAIAAEIATTRYVRIKMLAAGISKTKLGEISEDLTFSKMLNVDVFLVSPADKKPDKDLVGKINEIRRMRNKLMHEGFFDADNVKLREMYLSARAFISYLEGCN